MKKLVVVCQNNIDKTLITLNTNNQQITKEGLLGLQEGLIIFISKTPSGLGFPFDLPYVYYVSKLVLCNSFLNIYLKKFSDVLADNTIINQVQEIKIALNEFLSSGILNNIREIKVLNTNFIKLRKILDDDTSLSPKIKGKLKLFRGQLKKHQNRHPKLKIITKRLKKYWKNLFHCYDDKRIPRTNIDFERSFNALKRIKRKRSGCKKSSTFFSHEGKALILIENIISEFKYDLDECRFLIEFKSKRLLVSKEGFKRQSNIREEDKLFLKKAYEKKISVLDAGNKFQKLKAQINQL